AVGGPAVGLAANLASYGLAVLLYARIRLASEPQNNAGRTRGGLAEGFRYVVSQRSLAVVVGGFAVVTLAAGLVNATLPKFTAGLGLGTGGYAWALSAL